MFAKACKYVYNFHQTLFRPLSKVFNFSNYKLGRRNALNKHSKKYEPENAEISSKLFNFLENNEKTLIQSGEGLTEG